MDINDAVNEVNEPKNESVVKETFKVIGKGVLYLLSLIKWMFDIVLRILRPIITIILIFFMAVLFFSTINLLLSLHEPGFNFRENIYIIVSSLVMVGIFGYLYKE